MDTGTGLALLGGANLAGKILGPTADYIGDGIKTWTEKRANNVKNIFSIAARKLGDKIETKGAVPPRVLKGILDEGSFCDDVLAAEYFGGVLASSRSGTSRDDRGASFIALISRLSTYQIRTHYILYHIAKTSLNGKNFDPSKGIIGTKLSVPINTYLNAMEFDDQEYNKFDVIFFHIGAGLEKERLINGLWNLPKNPVEDTEKQPIVFYPSVLGIELFLWAYGKPDLTVTDFLDSANKFEIDSRINIAPGYQKTKE